MTAPLIIRADASAAIGTGHIMRCLALAQACRRAGLRAIFAHAETTSSLERRLGQEDFESRRVDFVRGSAGDAACTVQLARDLGATWIVADGYCFDAGWQRQIRDAGLRLLVIDDYGQAAHYHANIVLNQNLSADAALYASRDADTRLLLGPRYALLRQEFLARGGVPRVMSGLARRVLVTLGGSDPDNVTSAVLRVLRAVSGLEVVVVIGGSNPHRATVESLVCECNSTATWVRAVVDATDMPALMEWADVAITAGGSTLWELAYLGLPALVLVLAENQAPATCALTGLGIVEFVAAPGQLSVMLPALLADTCRRGEISARARELVDGRGGERAVAALEVAA